MLATGLRRGEALGLKWTDIETKLSVLNAHVERATTT
jgi:integrase